MDNNSNFEQQFTQNLKASAPASVTATTTASDNKLPLIVAIVLAVITLVESIVLVITLNNYFSLVNTGEEGDYEVPIEDESVDNSYVFDENYNLIAVNLTCVADDGASYNFTTDNTFEQYNGAGSLTASGSYTITNDSLISLTGSNKVLYYDSLDVADGLTVYTCEEAATEANADDVDTE